ncbi:MAG TPA: sugar transferase [Pirellulaceae bacterium]|nr:sugar transferase [Pirellulaceae bacterium]
MFSIKSFQRPRQVDNLMSEREFLRAVDEERMRVDRNGKNFSLVVFDCGRHGCAAKRRQLSVACRNRLRMIDQTGLLSLQEYGLLLPATDALGAQKVVSVIRNAVRGDSKSLPTKIYSYPGDALPESQSNSDKTSAVPVHPVDELLVDPLPTWKRVLDTVGAAFGLILTIPLMIAAAIAIKLDSPGPIVFTQLRAGLGGRPFRIYKFRTMTVGAEEQKHALRTKSEQDGPAFKIKADPRVTRVGRYLRRSCIDELPQLLNVLRGDMSLVGPRPLPCEESDQCENWQRRRLTVTPGLTCIWQVSGGMRIPFVEWMRMDIRYIRSRRLLRDLKLLWATLIAVTLHRASH